MNNPIEPGEHRDNDVSLQICPACNGEGHELITVHVYELGCGFSHPDVAYGDPCDECNGTGGALVPVDLIDFDELMELSHA